MPTMSKADQAAKVSQAEADRRRSLALAELREMERDQKRGQLLPAADVKKVWAEQLGSMKDRLLAIPDRLAASLAGRPEIEVRAALRDGIEDALRGLHAEAQQ